MGLLRNLIGLRRRGASGERIRAPGTAQRTCRFEAMEDRRMLSANPLVVGAVYAEEDAGTDLQGDTFEITFEGGALDSRLTRVVIDGDHRQDYGNSPGMGVGDVFFDTVESPTSLGVDHAFPFTLVHVVSRDGQPKSDVTVHSTVADGGLQLILDLTNVVAGDRLVFQIDVDEVQAFNPNDTDLGKINDGFDPLTSGAEFQGSLFTAYFSAPNYEEANVESRFVNRYDASFATSQDALPAGTHLQLPSDDANNNRDRTAGAIGQLTQVPVPVTLSGTVYHDRNEDLQQDIGAGEEGIAGVTLALFEADDDGFYAPVMRDGQPVTTTTDAVGDYEFGLPWMLLPGTYQIVEAQPAEFSISVGAVPGTVAGLPFGWSFDPNELTDVVIADGGTHAIDYDFAEANPASIAGCVYHDRNNDGIKDANGVSGETGLAGVRIGLFDAFGLFVSETYTDNNGCYEFVGLNADDYQIVEFQPDGWIDGIDTVGAVGGVARGSLIMNDVIGEVALRSGDRGTGYNFGERLGSLAGRVHVDQNGNCTCESDESGLPGVTITLVDLHGNQRVTTTDSQGRYQFTDLFAGTYTVIETQPSAYFNGGQTAGSGGGDVAVANRIAMIDLNDQSVHLVDYDFCETLGSLSGYVYHDRDNNGDRDIAAGDEPIEGVRLTLLDAGGSPVLVAGQPLTAVTDINGFYQFEGLSPGTYRIAEDQPSGWRDGKDTPGYIAYGTPGQSQVGSVVANDVIGLIALVQSSTDFGTLHGEQYNFGELRSVSIGGTVHADINGNCACEPEATFPQPQQREVPLSGVTIRLRDVLGTIVAETRTSGDGTYLFSDLLPGNYTIEEIQPTDFFDLGQTAGNLGGDTSLPNVIAHVQLVSGDVGLDYDFCEAPPASLSGYVFQDGPSILQVTNQAPLQIHAVRDGIRTTDDRPIVGVMLELRNGLDGSPVMASDALPGYYAAGPLRVWTDASGHYEFAGLPRGNYAVYQVHPQGYTDSIDTPGTTQGMAWNAHQTAPLAVLSRLAGNPPPRFDAILSIPLGFGQVSYENNFSEVRTSSIPKIDDPPKQPPTPVPPTSIVAMPPSYLPPLGPSPPRAVIPIYGAAGELDVTWHLSIVDAGRPRGAGDSATAYDDTFVRDSLVEANWLLDGLRSGQWTFVATTNDGEREIQKLFGINGAIPIAGDFDGDGKSDVGVFLKGEWFIDVNGNGQWDREDLWAQLGEESDLPVVGDWDGDGKDDIGIFGPIWERDPLAIEREPGLPDLRNLPTTTPKNVPPIPEDATNGVRILRLTADGEPRADLIDHVFRFGSAGDQPVAGDWDGDGIANIGVFRKGTWILDTNGDGRLSEADRTFAYGGEGDIPLVGDFNGDGIDVVGACRAGRVTVDSNRNYELDAADRVFELSGLETPIVGDFDGDGIDEVNRYRDLGIGGARAAQHQGNIQ